MEGQTDEHWQLLGEARRLTQEHASEEQSLARKQLKCSRLEGEIHTLRAENAQVQKQVRELHEEKDAKKLADQSLQTRLGTGSGKKRAAGLQAVEELRRKLKTADG